MRTGIGIDAHRFADGSKLFLCGVELPFSHGLAGHSDADVALHALMDALLGASGGGDIGKLFPDTDPALAGISSSELLARVVELVSGRGFEVENADIVIVCEEPRVAPYTDEMRLRTAEALRVDPGRVSVKGTTTEGMGFTGRREGILALASVLLEQSRG
jgi:2-C-methyl-D-erythritol 2,4-cyclodiphosphate synthase